VECHSLGVVCSTADGVVAQALRPVAAWIQRATESTKLWGGKGARKLVGLCRSRPAPAALLLPDELNQCEPIAPRIGIRAPRAPCPRAPDAGCGVRGRSGRAWGARGGRRGALQEAGGRRGGRRALDHVLRTRCATRIPGRPRRPQGEAQLPPGLGPHRARRGSISRQQRSPPLKLRLAWSRRSTRQVR